MKLIHLTDLHLTENKNDTLFGVNTYDNFDFIFNAILNNLTIDKVELIVVSGDISNNGGINSYKHFIKKMELFEIPYIAILGNHDIKSNYDLAIAEENPTYVIPSNEYKNKEWYISFVDTVVTGESYGIITEENLKELESKLITNNELNKAIFTHHPPSPVGTPIVDSCMLRNGKDLLTLCSKFKVKFIGSGHAHTPHIWNNDEMTVCIAPATSFQLQLGTKEMKTSKSFGFNVVALSSKISITTCIY